MKNIVITIVILIGITVLVTQTPTTTKANTSACSINAQLSGTGSTSATVKAKDEVNGTIFTLVNQGGGFYSLNGVNCEYYTITACASTTHGSATHVNFNTIGSITMQSGTCESVSD